MATKQKPKVQSEPETFSIEIHRPTAKRNPNTGKITATHHFDFGRIGPVAIAADDASWANLLKYIEEEPDNFLSDALEAATCAASVNPLSGRVKMLPDAIGAIRHIAPHLYVELKYWLSRKPLHPALSASLDHHGIKPNASGPGTPPIRVLIKMINSAYGTTFKNDPKRVFYKNYVVKRLGKAEAIQKKMGYPIDHRMFQEVLFPKK